MEPIEETHLSDEAAPQPSTPRRWPLGALSLVVIAVVVGGLLLFGGNDGDSAVDVPDLGETLGLPSRNGDFAADFSLTLLDGTPFRLTEHLTGDGRPVLLNLWASWCGPCRAEMPALDAASQSHSDVLFLGVAVEDDPDAARGFAAEIGVSYPLAIDESDRVSRRYPSPGLPATYLIGVDGVILRTVFGQLAEDQIDDLISETFGL